MMAAATAVSEADHSGSSLESASTGRAWLFKGRTHHPDHPACYHSSLPAGDMGEKRLVLVIDTPAGPQTLARQ